jgi:very-short-patch-repair endonuclease
MGASLREGAKTIFARRLRKSMTDAERELWRHLRKRQIGGFRFRRQHPAGPYIVDFICVETGLIVEVDGGQHNEIAFDAIRDEKLKGMGFCIQRFWNSDVLERIDAVLSDILSALTHPHPAFGHLPPQAGEGERFAEH